MSDVDDTHSPSNPPHSAARPSTAVTQFRSRKRPQKARKRNGSQSSTLSSTTDVTTSRADVFLLKAAQQLRDRTREASLTNNDPTQHDSPTNDESQPQENDSNQPNNDVAAGLHTNFSVERSGHALEVRMGQFIADGMARKFGVRNDHDISVKDKKVDSAESDVFDVPDWLRVDQKPTYDPGEGLPAAGMEEVDLPPKTLKQVTDASLQARDEMTQRRRRVRNQPPPRDEARNAQFEFGSNFSANFARHRSEWIEKNVAGRVEPDKAKLDGRTVRDKTMPSDKHPKLGTTTNCSNGNASSKRGPQASDAAFAERFRKRWRR